MKRIAMLALVVTVASCAEGNAPDGGVVDDGGGNSATYSVTGSVTGPGQANAALTLQGTGTPRTTTSNASGGFQFLAVPAGDYTLTVTQKGYVYTPPTQAVKVASANVKAADISSAAEQTGSAVSGTVSGDVKAKVLLTLTQNGATVGTTFSSDVGAYRLDGVADGTYTLTPSLAGYTFTPASQPVTVAGKAITAQEFVAKAMPNAVSGTVSGDVKLGVTLKLVGNGKELTATTDAAGVYSIADATDGTYTLTPSLAGYTFTPASKPVTVAGKAVPAQDFVATGVPYTVGGTVGGDVKQGVTLTLVGNGKKLEATTDSNGVFSVANATAGTYTLTPSLAGYAFTPASRTVPVTGANVTGQVFTSTAVPNAVSGVVSGDVKQGVTLKLAGNGKELTATTDATGTFTVANATTGTYTLTPSLAGYTFTPASLTVTVVGAAVGGQNFTSKAVPYAVSGAVSGDVKAGVTLTLAGNGLSLTATTDATGAFSVANATVGSYTLTPSRAGYTFTPASKPVTVVGASVTGQDFTSAALKYAVGGTVSGEAPAGVRLTLSRSGATDLTTLTATGGAFRIDGAVDGVYTLTPSLAGYSFTPASTTVTVAGAAVTGQAFTSKALTYAVSGTVSGDVKAGVIFTLVGNGKSLSGTTDGTGAFSIAGATNGAYTLTPSLTGYTFSPASTTVTVSGAAVAGQSFVSKTVASAATNAVSGTVSGDIKAGVAFTLDGNGKSLPGTTDATGAFSIAGVADGTYTLKPTLAGYAFMPATRTVTVAGAAVTGQDFGGVTLGWKARSPTGSNELWRSIASSSNGKYLAVVAIGSSPHASSDYGATWRAASSTGSNIWSSVSISGDGKYLAASRVPGSLYTSDNYGSTLQERKSGVLTNSQYWNSIAMSKDGKCLVAVAGSDYIYMSCDSGANWEIRNSGVLANAMSWRSAAISADGSFVAAVVNNGHVYISSNSGVTWEDKSSGVIVGNRQWTSIAMSADGRYLAAVENQGGLYTSDDHGANWKMRSSSIFASTIPWISIAMSADGKIIAAVADGGRVYTSGDHGVNWEDKSSGAAAGDLSWQSVSLSDDGRLLTAVVNRGFVFTYASP